MGSSSPPPWRSPSKWASRRTKSIGGSGAGGTVYPIVPDEIALGRAVGRNVPGITVPFRCDVLGSSNSRPSPTSPTRSSSAQIGPLRFFHFFFPTANPVGSPDTIESGMRGCESTLLCASVSDRQRLARGARGRRGYWRTTLRTMT